MSNIKISSDFHSHVWCLVDNRSTWSIFYSSTTEHRAFNYAIIDKCSKANTCTKMFICCILCICPCYFKHIAANIRYQNNVLWYISYWLILTVYWGLVEMVQECTWHTDPVCGTSVASNSSTLIIFTFYLLHVWYSDLFSFWGLHRNFSLVNMSSAVMLLSWPHVLYVVGLWCKPDLDCPWSSVVHLMASNHEYLKPS